MVAARVPCSRRDPAAGRAGLRGRAPTAPSASRAGAAAVGGRGGSEVVIFIRKRGFPAAHWPMHWPHSTLTLTGHRSRRPTPTGHRAQSRHARDARRDSGGEPPRERPSSEFWPEFIKDTCTTRSLKQTKHDTDFLGQVKNLNTRPQTNLYTCVTSYEHVCATGWQNLDASDQLW